MVAFQHPYPENTETNRHFLFHSLLKNVQILSNKQVQMCSQFIIREFT